LLGLVMAVWSITPARPGLVSSASACSPAVRCLDLPSVTHPAMGTILVGMATPQQFEAVLAAVQKGQLPPAALERLAAPRQGFAGEPR
jgi:hypothetical protein